MVSRTHGKTATSRPIPTDESALISEALRIASTTIREGAASLEKVFPKSPLVERSRVFAEQMDALRTAMDA